MFDYVNLNIGLLRRRVTPARELHPPHFDLLQHLQTRVLFHGAEHLVAHFHLNLWRWYYYAVLVRLLILEIALFMHRILGTLCLEFLVEISKLLTRFGHLLLHNFSTRFAPVSSWGQALRLFTLVIASECDRWYDLAVVFDEIRFGLSSRRDLRHLLVSRWIQSRVSLRRIHAKVIRVVLGLRKVQGRLGS